MRYAILLLLISSTTTAQVTKILNVTAYDPLQAAYAGKDTNGDSTYSLKVRQSHLDSLKAGYAIAVNGNTTANNANTAAVNAQTTANGAVAVNVTQASKLVELQTQINNIVIPPTAGIPKPIIKTASFTVSDTCFNRTIYMNCNGCTVTLPACSPGLRFWVQAAGGTVYLSSGSWVSGSTKTLSINSRPVMVDYKTSTQTNAR